MTPLSAGHGVGRGDSPVATFMRRNLPALLALLVAAVLFVADALVPRGATPAIGYALVPVLVGGSRKRSVVFWMTGSCTALTWLGFVLEPASGEPVWVSAFNRLMITGGLWLASLLVVRRLSLISALAERTQAVEKASEELSRSNAELQRFASRVAHDLRGPLNSIALLAKVLSQTYRSVVDADDLGWVTRIEAEVGHMSQLIQRLLVYGRVGGGALRLAPCETEAVLKSVMRSLAATLEPAGASVSHDPLPAISADEVLISELFQNLIENAVKYRSDRPPRIHVSSTTSAGEVVFAVRDNGLGISERDREAIFSPFTQLNRTESSRGLGLGLATCKRIVERHGGRIWVESVVGEGSTFLFALPQKASGSGGESDAALALDTIEQG